MKWIGQHIYDLVARFRDDVYVEESDLYVTGSETIAPTVSIKNTNTADAAHGLLKFQKDADNVNDGEILGRIGFYGDNDAGTPEELTYIQVLAQANDVSDSNEAGKLSFSGATNGASQNFLVATGDGTSSKIDIGLGYGTTSTTTVAGDLTVTGSDLTFDSVALTAIQTSAESFVDNDTSIMTSAAIADKVEAYGYSTLSFGSGGTNNYLVTAVSGTSIQGEQYLQAFTAANVTRLNMFSDQDTGDYMALAVTTHGATSITTVDDDAAAAHFEIVADGDINLSSASNKISKTYDYDTTTFETQLSDNEGSGEIIRYGDAQEGAIGQLHFLQTDGDWDEALATGVATGASQLLGIAMGSDPGVNGMLLDGYYKIADGNVQGTAAIGAPVYVSDTTGSFDFAAPADNNEFVRIVGYCIDIDSSDILLRFKPDNTWVTVTA